jgi:hypothetical protein
MEVRGLSLPKVPKNVKIKDSSWPNMGPKKPCINFPHAFLFINIFIKMS